MTDNAIIKSILGPGGYGIAKRFGYWQSVPEIAVGVCVDRSTRDKDACYIWATVLPLFPSTEYVYFTFSRRVKNGESFVISELSLEVFAECAAEVQRHVSVGQSIANLIDYIRAMPEGARTQPTVQEVHAYALTLAGDAAGAGRVFEELFRRLNDPSAQDPWFPEIEARARVVRDCLHRDLAAAKAVIAGWVEESSRNLGLRKG